MADFDEPVASGGDGCSGAGRGGGNVVRGESNARNVACTNVCSSGALDSSSRMARNVGSDYDANFISVPSRVVPLTNFVGNSSVAFSGDNDITALVCNDLCTAVDTAMGHTNQSPSGVICPRPGSGYNHCSAGASLSTNHAGFSSTANGTSANACGTAGGVARIDSGNPERSRNSGSSQMAAWRRREHDEPVSTEGLLRALLNKLAPSESLGSLAQQVAALLQFEDGAAGELARQLVERAQLEPLFVGTYAKLCALLVRVRSGFVFYKHLMDRCRSTFKQAIRQLILAPPMLTLVSTAPEEEERPALLPSFYQQQLHGLANVAADITRQVHPHEHVLPMRKHCSDVTQHGSRSSVENVNSLQSSGTSQTHGASERTRADHIEQNCPGVSGRNQAGSESYPTAAEQRRHKLRALVVFLCHLFAEELLNFEQLHADYLGELEAHLSTANEIAIECLCRALLSPAGRQLATSCPRWVNDTMRQLRSPAILSSLHDGRQLRLVFMIDDIVELQQRNWLPHRHSQLLQLAAAPPALLFSAGLPLAVGSWAGDRATTMTTRGSLRDQPEP